LQVFASERVDDARQSDCRKARTAPRRTAALPRGFTNDPSSARGFTRYKLVFNRISTNGQEQDSDRLPLLPYFAHKALNGLARGTRGWIEANIDAGAEPD
jgi:hypothetical protein